MLNISIIEFQSILEDNDKRYYYSEASHQRCILKIKNKKNKYKDK